MVDRIRQLMEHKGLTSTQLADNIEVPRAIVSHILSGRNKPSLDVVLKIVAAYRDVAMDWLLLGEGDMLINLAPATKEKSPPPPLVEAPAVEKKEPKETVPLVEKVQEALTVAHAPAAPEKAIEQIMIFYTDKTFSTYKPS